MGLDGLLNLNSTLHQGLRACYATREPVTPGITRPGKPSRAVARCASCLSRAPTQWCRALDPTAPLWPGRCHVPADTPPVVQCVASLRAAVLLLVSADAWPGKQQLLVPAEPSVPSRTPAQ